MRRACGLEDNRKFAYVLLLESLHYIIRGDELIAT